MLSDSLNILTAIYPQDDWGLVFSTVFTGLIVVFIILALLICIIWLMGKLIGGDNKKTSAPKAAVTVQSKPPVLARETVKAEKKTDNNEIIAVISAAVAAFGAAEGKTLSITGIKKKERPSRSVWGKAGIIENTQPKG